MRNAYYQLINYVNMSPEQDVFYYAAVNILDNIEKIPSYSITQLAEKCFASPATISRLVRRLNYDSFLEFKDDVKACLDSVDNKEAVHFSNEPREIDNKDISAVKEEYFNQVIANLTYTNSHFNTADIMDIVEKIEKANRIVFLGYNFSQMACQQMQSTLALFNKKTIAKTNQELQYDCLKDTNEDDLLILTTITGNYFRNRQKELKLFKASPAKKIIITQNMEDIENIGCDKYIRIGNDNQSYIGKYSVLLLFEMIEMFYVGKQRAKLKEE